MFVMSANSFLLALDMFRSKCIFYFIYIFFFLALQQAHGCGGQLPVYQGWYIASPLPSQVNCYSPSIRKVHQESMETVSLGPMCLVPPFLPYPYEIFHVQRIIQPSEDVLFPEQLPYEELEQYDVPEFEAMEMEGEDDGLDVPHAVADAAAEEPEDMRSTYPETYYLPHHVANHHQLAIQTAMTVGDESENVEHHPPPEDQESEPEEFEEVDPDIWAVYMQSLEYTPQYEAEQEEEMEYEDAAEMTEATEAPCHVEQTTLLEEISESTPVPEAEREEPVASASAMSNHHQDLLSQMHERYETEDEVSPCDGYFEKNAATLAHMLEQHFDNRHVRGSRSEGFEHGDASRLFSPIIKALKNIFGSFMSMADKPQDSKGKPTDSKPVSTQMPVVQKQEKTTTKPAEIQSPTQAPQESESVTTPEPESEATETPTPESEE